MKFYKFIGLLGVLSLLTLNIIGFLTEIDPGFGSTYVKTYNLFLTIYTILSLILIIIYFFRNFFYDRKNSYKIINFFSILTILISISFLTFVLHYKFFLSFIIVSPPIILISISNTIEYKKINMKF